MMLNFENWSLVRFISPYKWSDIPVLIDTFGSHQEIKTSPLSLPLKICICVFEIKGLQMSGVSSQTHKTHYCGLGLTSVCCFSAYDGKASTRQHLDVFENHPKQVFRFTE